MRCTPQGTNMYRNWMDGWTCFTCDHKALKSAWTCYHILSHYRMWDSCNCSIKLKNYFNTVRQMILTLILGMCSLSVSVLFNEIWFMLSTCHLKSYLFFPYYISTHIWASKIKERWSSAIWLLPSFSILSTDLTSNPSNTTPIVWNTVVLPIQS